MLIGYRPDAGVAGWAGATGLLLLLALALCWLCVALGMSASSVETASNTPMLLTFLPFLGSGFVPTDSMPTGLRWFAEYQPFTPITDTLRDLLSGEPVGNSAVLAAGVVSADRPRWLPLGDAAVPPATRSVAVERRRSGIPGSKRAMPRAAMGKVLLAEPLAGWTRRRYPRQRVTSATPPRTSAAQRSS